MHQYASRVVEDAEKHHDLQRVVLENWTGSMFAWRTQRAVGDESREPPLRLSSSEAMLCHLRFKDGRVI